MPRPLYRFSSHFMPILAVIIVISMALLALSIFPPPMSAYTVGGSSSPCKLTVQNNDPSLQNIVRRSQIAFNTVCPELVKRFALNFNVANNILLTVSNVSGGAAEASSNHIAIDSNFAHQNPNQVVGALTNELAMIIQAYPSNTPSWFATGMADYVRSVYGPADDDWSLPPRKQPGDSYTQGFAVTARFLHWLEQHTVPNLVDQLNRAVQTGQPLPTAFQRLTGGTVDALWSKYAANSVLIPFQRIPETDDPNSPICQLTVQNADSSLQDFVRRFQIAFNTACPEMAKHFASQPDTVKSVVLTFASSSVTGGNPAFTSDNHITADAVWMQQNPKQGVGALLHELTHVMQFTSPNFFKVSSFWFTEGMADYSRSIYGPVDDDWSMPPVQPTDSYESGYRVTARFLHWLEQHTTPNLVDQLNRAMQEGQPLLETFQLLTGGTPNQLWSKYAADNTLGSFQRIPAPDGN